ncbi:MAG: DnaJ domain-containing protein [Phycisphaerae bacterium]|nr:DnaJ domain-containing protein [Phycisphaerae bacterium]
MPDNDWQDDIRRAQQRERTARAVLGVSHEAGQADIRRAFRRSSLACHPDRGDHGTARRFHRVCCAYRCLTQGRSCEELDAVVSPPPGPDGPYRLDNPWGYWCWWRDRFFERNTPRTDGNG